MPISSTQKDMLRGALPSYSRIVKAANDNFGGPVRTKLKESNNLIRSVSENQEKIQDLYPKFFGKLTDTITTLANETDLTMRKIQDQQKEFQDAVIAKLTGTQQATRAGGAKAKPSFKSPSKRGSPRSGSGGASFSRPAAGGSRANSGRAVRQGGGVLSPSQGGDTNYRSGARGAEVRSRAGRIARRRAVTKGLGIAAAGIGAGVGFAGAAALDRAITGGGVNPSAGANNNRQDVSRTGATKTELEEAMSGVDKGATKTVAGGLSITTLKTRSGKTFQVNSKYAKNFAGFIADLEATGYQIRSIGGYSDRNIAGTNTKSWHALGVAIDINPAQNPVTQGAPGRAPTTDMPANINEIANKWGLGWGGKWTGSKQDAMHFSLGEGPGAAFRGNKAAVMAGSAVSVSAALAGAPEQQSSTLIQKKETPESSTGGAARNQPGGEIGRPSAGLNAEKEKLIRETAARFGMNPNALTGILNIESGGTFNPATRGGASNRYYGIFQLQDSQIPGLTRTALGQSLTPEQYQQRSFSDQLKVYEQYIKNAGVSAGFFTGDAAKDASRLWALQLAPGNARRLNYDDPNTVISRSRQAAAISAGPGLVTVGSVQRETLRRGGLEGGAQQQGATPLANQPNVPVGNAAQAASPPGAPQRASSGFTSPVDGARISSKFGYRIHPIRKTRRMHTGVDYAAPTGTPVKATADGTVVRAGVAGGYGNMVEVQHSDGTTSRYAHLHAFRTSVGQPVKQGQVIGLVGSTGMSTGPHLHFEIRKNGSPVDPLGMISGSAATVPAEEGARATEPIAGPGNTLAVPGPGGQVASQSATAGIPTMQMNPFVGSPLFGLAQMFGFMMGAGMPAMGGVKPIIINNTKTITRARTVDGGNLNQFPIVATSFFGAFARAF